MNNTKHRVESRLCNKCGETKDIIQRHKHATNTCDDCQRERAKQYQREAAIKDGRRVGIAGRKPYPGGFDKAARNKFYGLKTELDKCKYREEWIPLIKRNLDTALNDLELMNWIKSEMEDKPKGKAIKKIEMDLPDTRYMDWDEYQRGLGEEDVDS